MAEPLYWTLSDLKQHSHIGTDRPLPHRIGLTLVSQVVRMDYLVYMQVPNEADKVKFPFENKKSGQNLKCCTATTR